MPYRVVLTPTARDMLADIRDRRIRRQILTRLHALQQHPKSIGKPLTGELAGCYSLRVAAQRYRVIYTAADDTLIVLVIAIGIRKAGERRDLYEIARRLIRNRLVE